MSTKADQVHWGKLDAKAQGVVTSAGIFLAAVFAVIRPGGSGYVELSSGWQKATVTAALITLVLAVALAVYSMLIRQITAPSLGVEAWRDVSKIDIHVRMWP
jgi:hypothetical protein